MSFAASFTYTGNPLFERVQGYGASFDHFSILFDGRLHNRGEVARACGMSPGEGDAALALHAYVNAPDRFPATLIGEFALAIFDARELTLLCARDHAGVRPLYWFDDGDAFHCGTDFDRFFTLPTFRPRPNEGYIAEWLARALTSRTETLYSGISRLPAASILQVSRNGPSIPRRYWSVDFQNRVRCSSDDEYAARFREVFAEAVRCRCESETHTAVELSGGLDSTSIAGELRDIGRSIDAYSLVFGNPKADERQYISAAAAMFGVRSHLFPPTEYDRQSFEQQAIDLRMPPRMPNGHMSAGLRNTARASGVRILMNGVGGDDWLEGVSPHLATADLLCEGRLLQAVRSGGLRGTLHAVRAVAGRSRRVASRASHRSLPQPWIERSLARRVSLSERLAPPLPRARGFVDGAIEQRLWDGWRAYALESEWAAALRTGVELTYPFLDRRLIEFALAIPESQRFRNGTTKVVLRNAMRGIIPELVRTRTTKAEFSHLFPRALERVGAAALMQKMHIAELGWVDEKRLRAAYEEMRQDREHPIRLAWPIWMAVSLEVWARTLSL